MSMKKLAICVYLLAVSVTIFGIAPSVNATAFNPGNIIDDATFTNKSSMNIDQIQAFLNSKVPNCDTNGTQPASEFGRPDLTHAQYAAQRGWQAPPYTCLRNKVENGQSSAQIIYNVSQQFSINPQVLIVLLQKESSLVTDTWPLDWQYRTATGYGCPDTAPCDSQYYGLTNQITWAARLFQSVINQSPNWYSPYVVGSNYIRWSPDQNCGGSTVYIQNWSTAALYDYTPYQPNQAALNAGWGTGDTCSAYGNRNFFLYFNAWFNYLDTIRTGISMQISYEPDKTPAVGQTISYSYTLKNNLTYAITLDSVGAVGRKGSLSGSNADLGWQGPITLSPGETRGFTFSSTITDLSTLYVWPAVNYKGTYVQYNNWGSTLISHTPSLSLSNPATTNTNDYYAGQDVQFTATVVNNEEVPIQYDAIGIPVKFYDTYNYDATWVGPGTLNPGQTITLSGSRVLDKSGPFTYWVSIYTGGSYVTIGNTIKFTAKEISPNFTVSGLSLSSASPALSDTLAASFTVKNNLPVSIDVSSVGVVGRYGSFNGQNRDLGWNGPVHFGPGETKTFSNYSRKIADVGTHYYWIGILYNGSYLQYNNWGSTVVSLAPNFSVSALSLSNSYPAVGEMLGASFTVKNNLPVSIDVSSVGVVGRYGSFNGQNRDLGWQGAVHFNANETKTFMGYSRAITDLGTHYYWIGVLNNGSYLQYNNWGSTVISH